jgi:hypothetical protein
MAVITTFVAALALLSARSGSAEAVVPVDFGLRPGRGAPEPAGVPAGPSPHDFAHALGLVLLVAALIGLVAAVLYWSPWVNLGRSSARQSPIDEDIGRGPAPS